MIFYFFFFLGNRNSLSTHWESVPPVLSAAYKVQNDAIWNNITIVLVAWSACGICQGAQLRELRCRLGSVLAQTRRSYWVWGILISHQELYGLWIQSGKLLPQPVCLWSATPWGCSMQRWGSVGTRDTRGQQDHTSISLGTWTEPMFGSLLPHTWFGESWCNLCSQVRLGYREGAHCRCCWGWSREQTLVGWVKPPGIGPGKRWNVANSTLSLRHQGTDILCVSFMLVLTPRSSCGHPHLGVLRLPLCCHRTGHGLFAADLLFTLPVYITYRTGNKLWLQLPWNKPGVILVQPLLLFSRNSSYKWSLHLQAGIKLKRQGRGLFSNWIL